MPRIVSSRRKRRGSPARSPRRRVVHLSTGDHRPGRGRATLDQDPVPGAADSASPTRLRRAELAIAVLTLMAAVAAVGAPFLVDHRQEERARAHLAVARAVYHVGPVMLATPGGTTESVAPALGDVIVVTNDGGSTATIAQIRAGRNPVAHWAVLDPATDGIVPMALPAIAAGEVRMFLIDTGGEADMGLRFYDLHGRRIPYSLGPDTSAMGDIAFQFSMACSGDPATCPVALSAGAPPARER